MRLAIACSGTFICYSELLESINAHHSTIRYTTKAFSPIMAKAATLTIVEAENIVPIGDIDPNDVDLPGIYVDRIVPATDDKHIEIKKLREEEGVSTAKSGKDAAQIQRERIARRASKELKQGFYVNLGVGELIKTKDIQNRRLTPHRHSYTRAFIFA